MIIIITIIIMIMIIIIRMIIIIIIMVSRDHPTTQTYHRTGNSPMLRLELPGFFLR